MISNLVSLEYQGQTILVEAELREDEVIPIAATQLRRLEDTMGAVSGLVVASALEVSKALKQLAAEVTPPSTATLELGMQFTGAGDIFLVKASATAALKITLHWKYDEKA